MRMCEVELKKVRRASLSESRLAVVRDANNGRRRKINGEILGFGFSAMVVYL